jgi:hypothetical protein
MTLNDIICYAYHNNINFNEELNVISEVLIDKEETALDEDMVSIAIARSKNDNRLVVIPKRISSDESLKRDFKKKKIDCITGHVNSSNIIVNIEQKELTTDVIKSAFKDILKFKEFAEISIMNNSIFIQVSEKAKTEIISDYFYGYNVLFDKINTTWFTNTDLPYHWEYGEKVENTDKYNNSVE